MYLQASLMTSLQFAATSRLSICADNGPRPVCLGHDGDASSTSRTASLLSARRMLACKLPHNKGEVLSFSGAFVWQRQQIACDIRICTTCIQVKIPVRQAEPSGCISMLRSQPAACSWQDHVYTHQTGSSIPTQAVCEQIVTLQATASRDK